MSDLSDYPLDPGPQQPRGPRSAPRPPILLWVAAAVAIAAVSAAIYLWRSREAPQEEAAPATTETTETVPPVEAPLGAEVEPITVPLDQSDPIVRTLVAALSSHPSVAAWLATQGLIRNFVVVVENISTGVSPARHLRVLRPAAAFRVLDRDGELAVDPRSYDRYAGTADAVASIDAAGAATLYARLKPRIEEAYAELGRQEPFDRALERAIVVLLRTPAVDGEIRLEPSGGIGYRYGEPRLERLNAPQKHLLRMGPRHTRTIQGKLREIAQALGIPAERLPEP